MEIDVAPISELLGLDKEVVESSVKDGTLGQRIDDWKAKQKIMSNDDFEKLSTNLTKSAKDQYFAELVEQAKKGEAPKDLYDPIKGAALEMLEKDLSKKYNVADYSGASDLVEKIVKQKSSATDDQKVQDLQLKIDELKAANTDLAKAKEEAETTWQNKYKADNISRGLNQSVKSLPLDFSDKSDDEVEKVRESTHKILTSVFSSTYDTDMVEGVIVVKDKDGNVLKNNATLDPLPLSQVLTTLAGELNMKLKSSEAGGQGGKSSRTSAGITSDDDFFAECKRLGISPFSKEAIEMRRKAGYAEVK